MIHHTNVYRPNYDCTLNGISKFNNELTATMDPKLIDKADLLIVEGTRGMSKIFFKGDKVEYPKAIPTKFIERIEKDHVIYKKEVAAGIMFGSNFVWTSDSRFRENGCPNPVPVHDRVENYKG